MKTSLITLVSVILFFASCSNNQKAAQETTSDSISTLDTVKKVDTVTKDTITLKKSDRQKDEERDQKIMDDILKKRKTMK